MNDTFNRDEKMIARLSLALWLSILALPALADTHATGDEIKAAISGNTVQGTMVDAGAYTEFYAADGTIKGKDYAGKWTIEADKMCFAYDKPEADCFQVRLTGDQVTGIKDGKDDGTGAIMAGNPNGF